MRQLFPSLHCSVDFKSHLQRPRQENVLARHRADPDGPQSHSAGRNVPSFSASPSLKSPQHPAERHASNQPSGRLDKHQSAAAAVSPSTVARVWVAALAATHRAPSAHRVPPKKQLWCGQRKWIGGGVLFSPMHFQNFVTLVPISLWCRDANAKIKKAHRVCRSLTHLDCGD